MPKDVTTLKLEDDRHAEETSSEDEDELTQERHGLKDMLERDKGKESWHEHEDEAAAAVDDEDEDEDADRPHPPPSSSSWLSSSLPSSSSGPERNEENVNIVFTRLEMMATY